MFEKVLFCLDEISNRQASSLVNVTVAQPESSFSGYFGYLGNEVSQISNESSTYEPSNGYVGSIASTSVIPSAEPMYTGVKKKMSCEFF